ncbi:hypothetical protein L1987_30182 [Smallanthus sonchifolius]|uniref:Uncharacterized protein n=1 Tax=Smallanthus sonchifolius TaxID=185202 RepID=A0ACB9I1I5_9ASTR|nr:hypothetical protein L1987_30182 [Smallanthus sonchifolius]
MKERGGKGERYTKWKSVVPILYDWLANHNLVWPSLSCRWGALLEQTTYKNHQRLYLSEQTDGSVPNTLVIANCEIVKPRVAAAQHIALALDKSKYKDLHAVRSYIPRLEQDLELLRAKAENEPGVYLETQLSNTEVAEPVELSSIQLEAKEKLKEAIAKIDKFEDDDSVSGSEFADSEDLSDIFETDCETDEENDENPLYLNEFEKFPVESNEVEDDFEKHLKQICEGKEGKR